MRVKFIILGLLVLGISGCSSLSKEQCEMGDWHEIGRLDGQKGKQKNRLQDHVKACGEYSIRPNTELYNKGRQLGLKSYCTPANGFQQGRSGRRYYKVCPRDLEKPFLAKYRLGKKIYELNSEIRRIDSDIENVENQMDKPEVGRDERSRLRREIRRLERQKDKLRAKVMRIEVTEDVKSGVH